MKTKKIRWVPLLMVLSQLMLTGFVVYWLSSQYREEKKMLGEDIARFYEESRNQVIDSLVFSRVVEPALQDSFTITMMDIKDFTATGNKQTVQRAGEAIFVKCDTMTGTDVTVTLPDTLAKGKSKSMGYAFSTNGQDMLIRSVKLFISHTGDTANHAGHMTSILPGMPDTALFRQVFSEKVDGRHAGLRIVWTPDPADSLSEMSDTSNPMVVSKKIRIHDMITPDRNGRLQISGVYPDGLPGLEIRHGFPYLLSRITPQILFALILLLLTGSAFYFTHKSLRRQMILNGLRNDFVSNITHELKTPVSTVKVALEALKTFDKVNNPEKTREYLEMAGMEMDRLDRLITKVLDHSLIGEQNQVIQPQLTDLVDLTRATIENLQPRITSRNARIELVCEPAPDPVMVDPLHFQGVISNLLDNSLKYGIEAPVIQITIRQERSSVIIEVSDNGPGIPAPYLGRVFDKFFRVPNDNRHNIKGYGLGLSFAALVMEQHHGSIKVRNLPQAGCAFTLTFPATTA